MIVHRAECQKIIADAKGDRMGFVNMSEMDAAKVVEYCRVLLPVLIQAQRLYVEGAGGIETPCQASLTLALHGADPLFFNFDDCDKVCGGRHCTKPACDRQAWLEHLRWRASTPLPLSAPGGVSGGPSE